jgi:hypothetical protein
LTDVIGGKKGVGAGLANRRPFLKTVNAHEKWRRGMATLSLRQETAALRQVMGFVFSNEAAKILAVSTGKHEFGRTPR